MYPLCKEKNIAFYFNFFWLCFSIGDYTPTTNDDDNDNSHSSHEIEVSDITKEGCQKAQPSHFDLLRVLGQVNLLSLAIR